MSEKMSCIVYAQVYGNDEEDEVIFEGFYIVEDCTGPRQASEVVEGQLTRNWPLRERYSFALPYGQLKAIKPPPKRPAVMTEPGEATQEQKAEAKALVDDVLKGLGVL